MRRGLIILLSIILLCVGVLFWRIYAVSSRRITVLFATSPVSVWSFDTVNKTLLVVLLPSHAWVSSVSGYGTYSLDSLWKLGFIEKRAGTLLAQSIAASLAVPVPYYFGLQPDQLSQMPDPMQYAAQHITIPSLLKRISGTMLTNMPLDEYGSFMLGLRQVSDVNVHIVDITSKEMVTSIQELPDGSMQEILDQDRLDTRLAGLFEIDAIRNEDMTVAIYNTTATAALGTKAARFLTNQGILVVAVGNAEPEQSGCTIEGSSQALSTLTAATIAQILECQKIEVDAPQRADLVTRVGKTFAQSF